VDGHVHLHPRHEPARVLGAALALAHRIASPLVLLLAERAGVDGFSVLREAARGSVAGHASADGPHIRATAETRSLAVASDAQAPAALFVVAGRQIISREGIEVLALGAEPGGATARLGDGQERAAELVRFALAAGSAAVLPWGVGKWLGARGREVRRLAADPELRAHPLFFLGDIAARAWPWPAPAVFRAGPRVLPGTDLLPERGAEARVGSYRFSVSGAFDAERPAESLLRLLAEPGAEIRTEGRRQPLAQALASQLRLHLAGAARERAAA
jgi:hypothetical protein